VNVESLLCRSFAVIFSSIMLAILQSQPIFFPSWQIDHLIWVKGSGFRVQGFNFEVYPPKKEGHVHTKISWQDSFGH